MRLSLLLRQLDLLPVGQNTARGPLDRRVYVSPIARRRRSRLAKYMRMASNQLPVERSKHIVDAESPTAGRQLARHLRVKQHLQQQVAQFLGQVRPVATLDRVQHLVRLFQ